jgi:MarR family transcriptional regulator for hemolysin
VPSKKNTALYISEEKITTQIRAIWLRNFSCIKETLRRFDLTPVQWRVLANLQEYDGQNVYSLAERSYTNRANLSRDVAKLEKLGLVKRQRESRDQRNVLVTLTEAGKVKFDQARPAVEQETDFVLEGLSSSEIELLMKLLVKVKHNSYRQHPLIHNERKETS